MTHIIVLMLLLKKPDGPVKKKWRQAWNQCKKTKKYQEKFTGIDVQKKRKKSLDQCYE